MKLRTVKLVGVFWGILSLCVVLSWNSVSMAKDPGEVWNLDELKQVPEAQWSDVLRKVLKDDNGQDVPVLLQKVYYQGEPFEGRATRVFAYFARPEKEGIYPGVVLVHGGGGTAFTDWVELWAKRGYAAIAMDLAGCELEGWESHDGDKTRKKMPDGGPYHDDDTKFRAFTPETCREMWTYHAIANVMRAHSLLRSLPCVDPERTGATGISWGGYLTTMVAGIDDRFKAVVPVYGCGNLLKHSVWTSRMEAMPWEDQVRWTEYFDPIQYVGNAKCRMFFVTSTDDYAYPIDSHYSCYAKVPQADVRLQVYMPHGHNEGWQPSEIGTWMDSVLKGGQPLPCLGQLKVTYNEDGTLTASADVRYGQTPTGARLCCSTDLERYREWKQFPAEIQTDAEGQVRVQGTLPKELVEQSPLRVFLQATDAEGHMVSSHYQLCKPKTKPNFAPVPEGGILLLGTDAEGHFVNRFLCKDGQPSDWPVQEQDGVMTVKAGDHNNVLSDVDFQDAEIHVEFRLPKTSPGNSGLYIHGEYEMQIINSDAEADVDKHAIGALYSFQAPRTLAQLPPGEWQSYDIQYHAPRRDANGKIVEPGRVTAWLNGVLVQKETKFSEPISIWRPFYHAMTDFVKAKRDQMLVTGRAPLFLQDHGDPVSYRNIWIRPLE